MKITYTLTVGPMRESQLRPLLAALKENKQDYDLKADVELPEPEPSKKKPNGTAKDNDKLMATGKRARSHSSRGRVLTEFEKLEVEHGIASVSRKMLREKVTEMGIDSQIIYQLLRDGYLEVAK